MGHKELLNLIKQYGDARAEGDAAIGFYTQISESLNTFTKKKEFVSRKEAAERGLLTYFDGRVCRRGGDAGRRTSDGKCICEKCRAAHTADSLQRYKVGTEAWLKKSKKRKESLKNDKDFVAAQARYRKEWKESNRESVLASKKKRRAAKAKAVPLWHGEFDDFVSREACDLAERRQKLTGHEWHIDHMLPLRAKTVCGLHVGTNLQVIPRPLNLKKCNKLMATKPGEWIQLL